ncbi:MAG: GNAT family N-acetyltransferase [Chitinispirillia bacterium]|nr:GNAT family N-acetyltransferase [Chitinispirillia bacterium]
MELKGYGVTLRRLTIDKIELVRNWRNDPKISRHMFFKEYITPEMQLKWFNKINNDSNYYFIIEYNNEEIGLINTKDIDMVKKCGEVGHFIYEEKYWGTEIPFRASLCHDEFVFDELKLEYTYGQVAADNVRSIKYNKALGAIMKTSEDGKSVLLTFTRDNHYKIRNKYARLLAR